MGDQSIIISKANIDDIDVLLNLMRSTWQETYPELCQQEPKRVELMFSRDEVQKQISDPIHHIFIARDNENKEIGYAKLSIVTYDNNHFFTKNSTASLDQIYLIKDAQGLGYGKQLIAKCFEAALSHQLNTMCLRVADENTSARGFYQNYGFRLTSSIKDLYPTTGPQLIYGLRMACFDVKFQSERLKHEFSEEHETHSNDIPKAKL